MTDKEISIQITRYINGELSDREEDLLWEKFLEDRRYYHIFETELNLADLYRNQGFSIEEPSNYNRIQSPERNFKVFMTGIAAILLLSAMVYSFLGQSENKAETLAISEIDPTQMLGSEVFRDENLDSGQIDQQINRAISIALSGDNAQASTILNTISRDDLSDKQALRVYFNLGILAYNEEQFDLSLDNFSRARSNAPPTTPDYVVESKKWYISNVYLKQEDVDKAVQLLYEIVGSEGNYAPQAREILDAIDSDTSL